MSCMLPCSTIHRMKWKHMSMCLVQAWYWCSFVSVIADWLSENKVVGGKVILKTWEMKRSQSASFVAWVVATYSLSVVDSDINSCHLALQETAPVRGHFRVPTSPTEYLRPNTANTFCLSNTPYIPPHRRRLYNPYPNSSPSQSPSAS